MILFFCGYEDTLSTVLWEVGRRDGRGHHMNDTGREGRRGRVQMYNIQQASYSCSTVVRMVGVYTCVGLFVKCSHGNWCVVLLGMCPVG